MVRFLWWRFCGGVFVVVWCNIGMVFLWSCFFEGVFVVVILWWCFCGIVM